MKEAFKPINDFPDYLISNLGNVYSKRSEKILTKTLRNGLYYTRLYSYDLGSASKPIHKLVAEHFLEKPDGCDAIHHIDGDKTNNSVANLEYAYYAEEAQCLLLIQCGTTGEEFIIQNTEEVFKPINNFPDYLISNLGNVYSKRSKMILKKNCCGGFYYTGLYPHDLGSASKAIHKLVAEHFLEKPDGWDAIQHIDGDKTNNRVENLEYVYSAKETRRLLLAQYRKAIKKFIIQNSEVFRKYYLEDLCCSDFKVFCEANNYPIPTNKEILRYLTEYTLFNRRLEIEGHTVYRCFILTDCHEIVGDKIKYVYRK